MAALEGESPEEKTIRLKFNYLVDSLDVSSVLPAAYTAGLIDDRQRVECGSHSNSYKKTEVFLEFVKKKVKGNRDNFQTFLKLLRVTNHESNAQRLQDEYSKNLRESRVKVRVSPQVAASAAIQSLQSRSTPDPPVVCQEQEPPKIDLLGEELKDVQWDMLGTYLGFSQSEIREIEEDYNSTYRRRMEMFDKWLRKEVKPSWTKIIDALKRMSELSLADRLTKKYLSGSPVCADEGSSVLPHQQEQPKASPPTTTSKPLTVNNVFKVVIKCSPKWKKLGVLLDVEISDLAQIDGARKDHGDSMIDMLDVWLKGSSSNPSWNQLADALEQLGESKLAQAAHQNQ